MTTLTPKKPKAPDAVDELVACVVTEQVRSFQDGAITSPDRAWIALTGKVPPIRVTWGEVAKLIEDQYREMNELQTRKGKKNDLDHLLRKD